MLIMHSILSDLKILNYYYFSLFTKQKNQHIQIMNMH